jgi:hypothetical protein
MGGNESQEVKGERPGMRGKEIHIRDMQFKFATPSTLTSQHSAESSAELQSPDWRFSRGVVLPRVARRVVRTRVENCILIECCSGVCFAISVGVDGWLILMLTLEMDEDGCFRKEERGLL